MAQNIPTETERIAFESQIRELFGRTAYSHKTQEKMADRCEAYQNQLKLVQILLSAITASGVIISLFVGSIYLRYFNAAISFLTFLASGYAKNVDPGASAQKHRQTASDIWNVREKYLSLLADIRADDISIDTLRIRRDSIQQQLYQIYKSAPSTDSWAYAEAQKALKINEELTFTDSEINSLLPSQLWRTDAEFLQEDSV